MILITGGTGFLGKELANAFGGDAKILTRQEQPGAIIGNISDYSAVYHAVRESDAVFHLATESDQFLPYDRHFRTTVLGTENVLRAAEKTGVKVVHMSSAAVMTKSKTNYARAKADAEEIVKKYWPNVEAPILRASLIYDGDIMRKLKRLSYLPFPWKKQKIHLAYKPTVVRALIGAMKHGKSEVYSVADKEPVLLTTLYKELASPRPMLWVPEEFIWLAAALFYPVEKLSELAGVRPPMTATYLRYIFEDRVLDTRYSMRKLGYEQVDTLETIKRLKNGDTEI